MVQKNFFCARRKMRCWLFLYCLIQSLSLYFFSVNRINSQKNGDSIQPSSDSAHVPASYTVCNGLSNQLLGHAGHIAQAISLRSPILIPDVFIFHGVQTHIEGSTLRNVLPTRKNSIPLSKILDTDALLQMIKSYKIEARLIGYDDVLKQQNSICDWSSTLKSTYDDSFSLDVLKALTPSAALGRMVKAVTSEISTILSKSKKKKDWNGMCVHHRNGPDWQIHCEQWQGIQDEIWRKNCGANLSLPMPFLVKSRIPADRSVRWVYYISDEEDITPDLDDQFKAQLIVPMNRKSISFVDKIPAKDLKYFFDVTDARALETGHRDFWAAIDFFVCSEFESFVGNSVSTFSAVQIARRVGIHASWYNSGSIPLSPYTRFHIPIVYTYTEESAEVGMHLLKISIMSVMMVDRRNKIFILYHGSRDKEFLSWLKKRGVIIFKHEPKWTADIERIRIRQSPLSSHLTEHKGNFLGTWQRIDIHQFLDSEYCLFIDSDVILSAPITFRDFGIELPTVMSLSTEMNEDDPLSYNAGVMLLNIPNLRLTYQRFRTFLHKHAIERKPFINGPGDQGAYLDFYSGYISRLDPRFNVKPYWRRKEYVDQRKLVHFHGAKPHQILRSWMGLKSESVAINVILKLLKQDEVQTNCCIVLRDFALAAVQDVSILLKYCQSTFEDSAHVDSCFDFFMLLSKARADSNEVKFCRDGFLSLGQAKIELNSTRVFTTNYSESKNIW